MSASGKRFRIAFSFAGEKREYVAQVADILGQHYGKEAILYDKFHEEEFARRDLGIYLPELYHKQSDLVVVVACDRYDAKQWTGLEFTAIHDLLSQRKDDEVLLCRFDRAEVIGLYSTAGWIDLDEKKPPEFADLILKRLARIGGAALAEGGTPTIPPKSSIPNNLPRLQSFFGREKELAAIREALDPENRTWGALIDGPGGMGKTSLAVRAAYDVPARNFERIIFVSIKDREMEDDGVRRLTGLIIPGFLEMLNEIARELGRPEITKAAEDQRIRLLLDALRPARALLILDNLESLTKTDRGQLFTLVKRLPQGCKAILTSRGRIGSGSEELILEQLDQDAALATLADLARHNKLLARTSETERIALYTQTAGKPLLLRWVAGQLGRGSCRTFTDALAFLRACPSENDPLEFVFGDLVEDFTPDETRVLSALSYFTLPAKAEHIEEIAALGKKSAMVAVRTLANRSLVVPDEEEEKFALVPLVADFLRRRRPEAVAEIGGRVGHRAYELVVEHGFEQHERFRVLDGAWPTVAAALPIFLTGSHERLQVVCAALYKFLDYTDRWDELLSLSQHAETAALEAGDYENAGWRAYQAGWVLALRQEAADVLKCAGRVASHWERARVGTRERSIAIRLRGAGHELQGDNRGAIRAYREALELNRRSSPRSDDLAATLNDLANAERLVGDYSAADTHTREALGLARANEDTAGEALYMGNLVALMLDKQDWSGAEVLARQVLPCSEKLGRQEMIAEDCRRLAMALVRQGRGGAAFAYARRAVDVYTHLSAPRLTFARGTLAECRAQLLRSLEAGWTHNTTALEGNTLSEAEVASLLEDPKAAVPNRPREDIAATNAQLAANKWVAEWLRQDRSLTKDDICALHTVLMQGSPLDSLKPVGAWKIEDNGTPVRIGGAKRWNDNYAAHRHVPSLMNFWLDEFNRRREGSEDPFADHVWLHATLVRIHPFADGNGRLARLLANVPLISGRAEVVDIPATSREEYLAALAQWQFACGAPTPGDSLYSKEEELADFIALCRASLKQLKR
jgi:fido (protein-threonine AMPylation protein)/tetratricopeptide (TPR) repeat protein